MAKTPPGLDAYRWHSNLGEYGHSAPPVSQDGHQYEEEDESEVVVNALVSSVVIPRLEKLAKESFDPLSKNQTTKALALLDEISYCVERKSQRFEVRIPCRLLDLYFLTLMYSFSPTVSRPILLGPDRNLDRLFPISHLPLPLLHLPPSKRLRSLNLRRP